MNIPTNSEQVKTQLQLIIDISKKGILSDSENQSIIALKCYNQVIDLCNNVLFYYNHQKKSGNQDIITGLLSKRDKYVQRVNFIWDTLSPELKSEALVIKKVDNINPNRSEYTFSGIMKSYRNISTLFSTHVRFIPYSPDPLISTIEKVQRIAETVHVGAFITSNLFITPDVWYIAIDKIEGGEQKEACYRALQNSFAQVFQVQSKDPKIENISLFKATVAELKDSLETIAMEVNPTKAGNIMKWFGTSNKQKVWDF
jgi:hypothetical protein